MSESYTYYPKGVCSKQMDFEIEDGIIKSLKVTGGCNGNLNGISRLLVGMPVDEVIDRIDGVRCGLKPTSCPDQIAKGLQAYKSSK